ncbi:MAG: hypothetical protein ACM3MA_00850 [Acidobacteriota bacterium]
MKKLYHYLVAAAAVAGLVAVPGVVASAVTVTSGHEVSQQQGAYIEGAPKATDGQYLGAGTQAVEGASVVSGHIDDPTVAITASGIAWYWWVAAGVLGVAVGLVIANATSRRQQEQEN